MNWFDLLSGLVLLHAIMATVAVVAGFLSGKPRIKQMASGLLLAVSLMQTGVMLIEFGRHGLSLLPRSVYLEGLTWVFALTSLLVWRRPRLEGLLLVLAPFTLIIALAALLLDGQAALPETTARSFFNIHVACVFPALACMAAAFGAAVLFLLQEHTLKSKRPLSCVLRTLPPQSVLDKVNAVSTMLGFPLYSLGILFGMVSARLTWGFLLTGDPKEIISLLVWLLYAMLFHQRLAKGWRGKKPAYLALSIFGVTAFSLFVVNVFMNTYHSFLLR